MKGNASAWKPFSLGGKDYRTRKERCSAKARGAIQWSARIEQRVGEDWKPYAVGQWTGELIRGARPEGTTKATRPAEAVVSAAELALMARGKPRTRFEIGAFLTPARLESLQKAAQTLRITRSDVMRKVMDALGEADPERALGALGREIREKRAAG